MASAQNHTHLCKWCKSLTFVMPRDGYTHPLPYRDTIVSGRTCRLCRLMICSTGKLQAAGNAYQFESKYDSMSAELPQLPAVSRRAAVGLGFPVFEILAVPQELAWSRSAYMYGRNKDEVRKGNYNDGETILITAPEDSCFRTRRLVPLRSPEPASSTRNYKLLREWLATCISSHETCRPSCFRESGSGATQEHSTLPSRVIDVGFLHEPPKHPSLLQTNGMSGQYICLSHRWGNRQILRTDRSNLEQFQQGLPMESMPPTFRDAMEVTRQLGFRYLWIDSLCIIQDDADDWMRECQAMGGIFEKASCTLAAVDALDHEGGDRGLFLPRDSDRLEVTLALPYDKVPLEALSRKVFKKAKSPIVWKYRWLAPPRTEKSGSRLGNNIISIHPRVVSLYKRAAQSEWYHRGWVLQERLLSRRIIYYTKEKLYWSCFITTGEEQGDDPDSPTRWPIFATDGDLGGSAYDTWQRVISDYVRCGLTYSKDRLAALRGVFTKLGATRIHAGILDDPSRPGDSLLWYTRQMPLQAFHDFHAPSWTWACLDGIVSFYLAEPSNDTGTYLIRDLRFKTGDGHGSGSARGEQGACGGACVSGTVSFIGPAGKLSRGRRLMDVRVEGREEKLVMATNGELLRLILGSALCRGDRLPRFDQGGNQVQAVADLPVPRHTEILVDQCGCVIGFFIPDYPVQEGESRSGTPIVCVGIKHWRSSALPQRTMSLESESWQEETVEIIGLEEVLGEPGTFRRLGRGRVICNSWLSRCTEEVITIM